MEVKAFSYEYMSKFKKILVPTVILGLIAYFALFYTFFDYNNSDGPLENLFIGLALGLALMIVYTPFIVESMLRHNFMKTVGRDKFIFINADGLELKNTIKGVRIEKQYNWSQITGIEITDMSAILGKLFANMKFFQMRIIFDGKKYFALCEEDGRKNLELKHSAELESCCFDMEYTQAAFEEIKTYCNPDVVRRKRL